MNIDEGELKKLAGGEFVPFDHALDNGYVILSLKRKVLGLGLLIEGMVRSQIPHKDLRQLIAE